MAHDRDKQQAEWTPFPGGESERLLEDLAEQSDDVFWIADPVSSKLLYVNAAFEKLWALSAEQLFAAPEIWEGAILDADREAFPGSLVEADDPARGARQSEYRITGSANAIRWVRDRRFPIRNEAGVVVRTAGIAEDITERKVRELELSEALAREQVARASAEALARAKDEFLTVVSHELRSPLNAIRGWSHVLARSGHDATLVARAIDAIQRNTDAQIRVIDDLLDSARIVQGKMNVELQPVALNAIVEAALEIHQAATHAKDLRLEVDLDLSIGVLLLDPDRIQQIIVNLLSNATKFTAAGGSIRVTTRLEADAVVVAVMDDGIGIAPTFLPHVFERFRQADSSSKRRHGGLGLGLSLARYLAELHGGSIEAHSDGLERGATFRLNLPRPIAATAAARSAPASAEPTVAPAQPLRGAHVVVIDDSDDGREIATFILRGAGATVHAFAGSAAALQVLPALRTQAATLIALCDLAMPGEDGYAFISALRIAEARTGAPRLHVYALTAHTGTAHEQRALAAGFDGYLTKPFDPHGLIVELARHIG